MVIAGLVIPASALSSLTNDLLALKQRFYPNRVLPRLDYLLQEIKGSELRADIRKSNIRRRKHSLTVLDQTVSIITRHDARLVGRIWVKAPGVALEPSATYTFSIQDVARHFNHFLEANNSEGLILGDSRNHQQDIRVAHSVFTLKHKTTGDELPRILESVVFGKSDNHAGLQLADIVASGLLFPMAARAYCAGHASRHHASPRFDALRERYTAPLKQLLYTYKTDNGKTRGGLTVSDKLNKKPSSLLFDYST